MPSYLIYHHHHRRRQQKPEQRRSPSPQAMPRSFLLTNRRYILTPPPSDVADAIIDDDNNNNDNVSKTKDANTKVEGSNIPSSQESFSTCTFDPSSTESSVMERRDEVMREDLRDSDLLKRRPSSEILVAHILLKQAEQTEAVNLVVNRNGHPTSPSLPSSLSSSLSSPAAVSGYSSLLSSPSATMNSSSLSSANTAAESSTGRIISNSNIDVDHNGRSYYLTNDKTYHHQDQYPTPTHTRSTERYQVGSPGSDFSDRKCRTTNATINSASTLHSSINNSSHNDNGASPTRPTIVYTINRNSNPTSVGDSNQNNGHYSTGVDLTNNHSNEVGMDLSLKGGSQSFV
jgi:hypothetical protein